ncbi:MAG: hypothetical protein PHG40_03635, partial [Candidatus Omnitrophica bacterium]|nr:hypothetical protein [Candidatus Omnitrophota bacterium]
GQPCKLTVFSSATCHRCLKVKNEIMPRIEKEFGSRLKIEYRDIGDMNNYLLLLALIEEHKAAIKIDLPVFYSAGKFVTGDGQVRDNLIDLLSDCAGLSTREPAPSVDLLERFKSFRPFAIAAAGLADGINPCAFTVIVFFISFLALQGYRRRELLLIGSSFILAVFLTYVLLGLGVFAFLFRLKGAWIVTKALNICVGIASIALGVFSLYDLFKFRKSGQTEALALQLPKAVKDRIHYVVGFFYRKGKNADIKPGVLRLVLSAFITGFVVSLLEAVCTGQLYIPTIAFIFKTTPLKLQAGGYLIFYNIMFILPLAVIFSFAMLGATSGDFSKFMKRHMVLIKLILAVIFFAFGLFLLLRA